MKYCVLRLIVLTWFFSGLFLQTLGQLAAGKEKYVGNIGGGNISSDFGTLWNQITPENGGKWGSVEANMNVMSWGTMDVVNNYSKTKGIPIRFHTLIWGNQQPAWMTGLSAEQQLVQIEEWIKAAAARYPNVDMIDVVNEPLPGHAPPAYKAALGGDGTTGWDWVIKSFELARKYFPNAKLHINDYHILSNGTNVQTYIKIINLLKTRGLIDGIGCQSHFLESTSASIIRTNLNSLAALGLPIYITEFDLNLADDTQQLNKYKELFPLLYEHSAVKGITLWGYRQGSIWRTDAYLIRSNGTMRPALTWLKEYFTSTGAGYQPLPEITVYPNPAVHTLNISGAVNRELTIYTMSGQLVYQRKITDDQESIEVSEFPSGLLLCRIFAEGKSQTWKITKK